MAYAFFHKYQRPLLMGLTLFVLLTFSVTGAMTTVFQTWFSRATPFPTITLPNGEVIRLTADDYEYATALYKSYRSPVPALVQVFDDSESETHDTTNRRDVLAILRRAAIAHGIEVSDQDVHDAKKKAFEDLLTQGYTPTRAAEDLFGPGASESEFDSVIKEAMRISTLVRLQLLDNDFSSAALMDYVRKEKKETSYSYAAFPAKPKEDELEAKPLDDAALMQWIEKLPATEQRSYRDSNHAAISVFGLRLAEFDENDWTTELRDFKLDESVVEGRYNRDKEVHYRKVPASKPASPESGPATRESRPASSPTDTRKSEKEKGGNVLQDAAGSGGPPQSKPASAPASGDTPTTQSASKPVFTVPTVDQATYIPLADVRAEIEKRLKVEAVLGVLLTKALAKAKEDGDKFEFLKWADAIRKEKQDPKAMVTYAVPEPKSAEDLKTLDRLGTWHSSFQVGFLQKEGDLSPAPQPTSEGALIFRADKIVKEPFKPIDKIRTDALKDRVKKEAMAQVKQQSEDLLAALRERAKTKVPDAVAKIQETKNTEVEKRMRSWRENQERTLRDIDRILAEGLERASREYAPVKERIQKELAAVADHEKKVREQVDKENEEQVFEAVAAHLGEVFDEVAKEKGLTIQKVEPFLPGVQRDPDYKTRYADPTARYLIELASLNDVKKGQVSAGLEDMTNRAYVLARVDERKLPAEESISRTEFRQMRRAFEESRMRGGVRQAYSFKALEARYKFKTTKETAESSRPAN